VFTGLIKKTEDEDEKPQNDIVQDIKKDDEKPQNDIVQDIKKDDGKPPDDNSADPLYGKPDPPVVVQVKHIDDTPPIVEIPTVVIPQEVDQYFTEQTTRIKYDYTYLISQVAGDNSIPMSVKKIMLQRIHKRLVSLCSQMLIAGIEKPDQRLHILSKIKANCISGDHSQIL
jgi:hypothetical protein